MFTTGVLCTVCGAEVYFTNLALSILRHRFATKAKTEKKIVAAFRGMHVSKYSFGKCDRKV